MYLSSSGSVSTPEGTVYYLPDQPYRHAEVETIGGDRGAKDQFPSSEHPNYCDSRVANEEKLLWRNHEDNLLNINTERYEGVPSHLHSEGDNIVRPAASSVPRNQLGVHQVSRPQEIEERRNCESQLAVKTSVSMTMRAGVWGALGRAVGSFLGRINGDDERNSLGNEAETSPSSNNDSGHTSEVDPRNQRPPTDFELFAMYSSPSSRGMSGSRLGHVVRESVTLTESANTGALVTEGNSMRKSQNVDTSPTNGHAATKMPLSLTPMQPPPDVVAAMQTKGGVRGKQQLRQRSMTPPPDVVIALEKLRVDRNQREGVPADQLADEGCTEKGFPAGIEADLAST